KPSFNNRYVVTLNDQKGLVDSSGKVLVNYVFDELYDLNNGYVLVEKMGKMGVVNMEGLYVIPRSYDQIVYEKTRGYFLVKQNMNWRNYQYE
ncbi:MAG: WG repeat-containing protein, partial [Cyclobacteriaceae bacterium]|nr:WG repeat-containing protein [Cyclobacteriaceae bacterium]